jgi:NAD(P)-dependent dehydrogenase (short-subunit alcohol dehydrogenase family)
MEITGSVALVTGANRGLGRHFAQQLRDRGARRVYATARDASRVDLPGVEVLALDITDPAQVAQAAAVAGEVSLVVNNAGVATYQSLLTGDLEAVRLEMETHYFGTLAVVRAFAPVLAANGGGAILNVLSALSWFQNPSASAYAAAKAAAWSLTDAVRLELADQGTQVVGLHAGAIDTDMMAFYDGPKGDPAHVVATALDALEAGDLEVLVDDAAAYAKAALARTPGERYGLVPAGG